MKLSKKQAKRNRKNKNKQISLDACECEMYYIPSDKTNVFICSKCDKAWKLN